MGRMASIPFTATAISAAVDCFEVKAAAAKPFILHEVVIGQSSVYSYTSPGGLAFTIKKAGGSYTSGSGGTTIAPEPHNTSDSVAVTGKTCNTTRALVGSGTLVTIRSEGVNEQGGWQYLPTPESRIPFMPGEAAIIGLESEGVAATFEGTMVIEELG